MHIFDLKLKLNLLEMRIGLIEMLEKIMLSMKCIAESNLDSIKIHTCHMHAFLPTESAPFS